MSKEAYFCRFEEYWCVECCEGRECCNLGKLPDNTRGCLGYNVKSGEESEKTGDIPIPDFCKSFYCWERRIVNGTKIDTPEMLKKTYEAIKKRPVGEYKMDADIIKPMLANLKKSEV